MIVVDASVALDFVLGAGSPAGDSMAEYLQAGETLAAPHLVDAEVGQGLRRFTIHGDLTPDEARSHLSDFLDIPIRRYPHSGLLTRAFEFRASLTVYDGLYLALAEALDCRLLTGDGAHAKVPDCDALVEVLPTSG